MFIDHIFYMDNIFDLEKNISKNTHQPVTNLSHWNPSDAYVEMINRNLPPQSIKDIFNYVYTYDIPASTRKNIINKLVGRSLDTQMCMILPNSTLCILNVINYLKLNGCKRLFILQPSYFSVEEACKLFNIEAFKIPLKNGENYTIPIELYQTQNSDAFWITSPVYSTSYLLNDSMINCIDTITANKRYVVIDESLNINGLESIRKLKDNKYLFGIYSPHKALFCNGLKFSTIICNKSNDDFLEQWIDVLGGALPSSCINAIDHFLSPNFEICKQCAVEWFSENQKIIIKTIKNYPFAHVNENPSVSSYMTINLPYIPLESLDFIEKMIKETFTSVFPGFLNGRNDCSFRINLSLNKHTIGNSLNSLLDFISRQIF